MATNSDALQTLLTTILGAFKDPHHALTGDGPPESWTDYGHLTQKVLGIVSQLGDIPGGIEYLSANDTAKLKATLSNEIALQEKQAEAVLHAQMHLLEAIATATVDAVSEVGAALASGLEEQKTPDTDEEQGVPSSDDGPEDEDSEGEAEQLPPEPAKEGDEDEEPAPAPLGTPSEKNDAEPAGIVQPAHGYGTEGTPSGPETTTPTPDAPKPSDPGPSTVGDPTSTTPGIASVTAPAETIQLPAETESGADEGTEDKGEEKTSAPVDAPSGGDGSKGTELPAAPSTEETKSDTAEVDKALDAEPAAPSEGSTEETPAEEPTEPAKTDEPKSEDAPAV